MVFIDQIEYPAEVFYQLTLALVPLGISVYLWLAVYRGGGIIGNFNLSSMITYYFVVLLLNRIMAHPAFWIADMVERGELSTFLVKPFPFLRYLLIHSLTRRLVNLVISIPLLIVALFLLRQYLIMPSSLVTVILFGFSCMLAVAIYFLFGLLMGLVSLWTLEIGSITFFYYETLAFLGGAILPLSFFPPSVSGILAFLPFKYLYYFPAQLYLGNIPFVQILSGILVGVTWVVVLYLASSLIFILGLRRYSSFGN